MAFNGGVGKRLLNVEEAAGYLGLKVDTVYKKARLRGASLRQGGASVAVRQTGVRSPDRTAHNQNHRLKGVRRVSIHRVEDGVLKIRWREGGRNRSLSVHGSHELAMKILRKRLSARDENRQLDIKREVNFRMSALID